MPQRTPNEPAISSARKPKAGSRKPIPQPPSTPATRVKSFVRKILLASPVFPRLYADVVISSAPNSNEAKILAHNYKKIVALSNERNTQMSHPKSCTHIKVTGVRCGSPALRGEQFCYFHQRMLRSVRFPSSRVLRSALLEDPESIQASLMEVVNGLLRGTLELKRGELILRALNTAVRNIRHVRFDLHQDEMIREIPNYPDQPPTEIDEPYEPSAAPRRPPTREEVARFREADLAAYFGGPDKVPSAYRSATPSHAAPTNGNAPHTSPTHVGTDAFVRPGFVGTAAPGCPGGPELPGRNAVPPKPPLPSVPPNPAAKLSEAKTRKPPQSVKPEAGIVKAQAPKKRKNAAHGASRG